MTKFNLCHRCVSLISDVCRVEKPSGYRFRTCNECGKRGATVTVEVRVMRDD